MIKVQKFSSFEELKADQKETGNDESTLNRHKEYEKFFKHLRSLVVQQEKNGKLKCEK